MTGWADNLDLAATWGITDQFLEEFNTGFEVRPGGVMTI